MFIEQIEKNEIFCSVVMPVHNGGRFLREAIESVLGQTYTNFEFLIVENCSSDSSVEIIKSYNDPRIRLIIEEDCGHVQAYNRGFREAKGEYIFIHDHDDISENKRFEKQLERLIKDKLDIVGSSFNIIDLNGRILYSKIVPANNDRIRQSIYSKINTLYNPTICINKNVFRRFGTFNKEYYGSADYEFYLRIIDNVKVGNIQELLYNWRLNNSSLSQLNTDAGAKRAYKLAMGYLDKRKNQFDNSDFIYIKSKIDYHYDNLLKSILRSFIGYCRFYEMRSAKLLIKSVLLFFPLKLFGREGLFNSRFIFIFRKIFNIQEED